MKFKQRFMVIFTLLFSEIKSNFFTYGLRKVLGFSVGSTGLKETTIVGKSFSQSSGLSSQMISDQENYKSKKKKDI